MAQFAYTPPNGQMFDPTGGDAALAQLASDPRRTAIAFPLLVAQTAERQIGNRRYLEELRRVNELQQQGNIANRAADTQKLIGDLLSNAGKYPGTIEALATNPIIRGLLQGTEMGGIAQGAWQGANAENYAKIGKGSVDLVNARMQPDINAVSRMINTPLAHAPTPSENAAAMRASADRGPKIGTTIDPVTNRVTGYTFSTHPDQVPGMTAIVQDLARRNAPLPGGLPIPKAGNQTTTPTPPPPPSVVNPPQSGDITPPKIDAPTTGTSGTVTAQNLAALKNTNPKAYDNVLRALINDKRLMESFEKGDIRFRYSPDGNIEKN